MTDENGQPSVMGSEDRRIPSKTRVLELLSSKSFEIQCPLITLTQCQDNDPETIRGRGTIRLLGMDAFELWLYADDTTNSNVEIDRLLIQRTGTIVPESEYYLLSAVDYDGVEW